MVVVILPLGQSQDDLGDPSSLAPSLDSLDAYSESFCDQEFTSAKAYITAEFAEELFPNLGVFIVGGEGVNAPNDRPNLYTNGLLCYSGRYTFFVRAYTQESPVRTSWLKNCC